MEFSLLGTFEIRVRGRRVGLGSRRQERCLLGVLLLEAGSVVTTARLIDLLWDGAAPPSARGTVHTYVGRLRALLGPHGLRIESRHGGYTIDPDADGGHTVDIREFLAGVERAATAGSPAERVRAYDAALALWRGPLLADVFDDRLRGRLGARLAEARLTALERRAEDGLTLGMHERVLADLTSVAEEHPLRERLVAARMTALYRSGRRAEALELYRHTHRLMVAELGIEPGAALSQLHERMLRSDARLDRPSVPHAVRVGDEWLPWSTGGHPALEFCNTYAGWGGGPRLPGSEWLRRYSTLAVWAGHHDLADGPLVARLLELARTRPDEAAAALEEARRLRADLYACLTDMDDARAFRAVAEVAQEGAASAVFVRGEDGLGSWRFGPSAGLRLPVLAAARCAAELLADPRRFTVRACPSEDCGWLFLDLAGRRRWCSTATCGTRRPGTPEGTVTRAPGGCRTCRAEPGHPTAPRTGPTPARAEHTPPGTEELHVTHSPPETWDAHYASGRSFRPLGDDERRLLAEHAPAPDGAHALDIGCGLGELARHLADRGYRVDAVDWAPGAVARAEAEPGNDGTVSYRVLDIERDGLDALRPAYDLITLRLSWAFLRDRTRVMSRLRERLRPGGTVCVITPVAETAPHGKRDIALDEDEIALLRTGWGSAERHDAGGLAVLFLRDPAPARVTYAGRRQPSPHALTGAGAVVTDPDGRVLLGWSRRGVWELPGGKNDAGEGFVDAAVRELAEETGLRATKARLLALLMDATHGIPRMTAAVRVVAYTGEPVVTEPHLVHRWEWHEPADLPALAQPLFTPSAHVIDTVWPGLLTGLPPVHRYPVAGRVEHTHREATPG